MNFIGIEGCEADLHGNSGRAFLLNRTPRRQARWYRITGRRLIGISDNGVETHMNLLSPRNFESQHIS